MTMQNLFPFLEDTPEGRQALFQTFLPENLSGRQLQFAQSLFEPTFNSFLGTIGRQIQQGQQPQTFADYLGNSNQFNFQRELVRGPSLDTPGIVQSQRFGF